MRGEFPLIGVDGEDEKRNVSCSSARDWLVGDLLFISDAYWERFSG